MIFTQF